MNVIVMAGTSDSVRIIEKLSDLEDIEILATTTTQYGAELADPQAPMMLYTMDFEPRKLLIL